MADDRSHQISQKKFFKKFFKNFLKNFFRYPSGMRAQLLIPLVALLLSACDPYAAENAERRRLEAEIANPCIAAVRAEVERNAAADSDFRGFKLYGAQWVEHSTGVYTVHVRYQKVSLTAPVGGPVWRRDCELRNGQVIALHDQ